MRHVGGHFVSGGFGYSIDGVAHVLLGRPETDVDYKAAALGDHHLCGARGAGEGGTKACVHHAVPAMRGLFPEGQGPLEYTVFDHPLIAGPGIVHQNVQLPGLICDSVENLVGLVVAGVVAGEANYTFGQGSPIDGAPCCEDLEAGTGKADRDISSDTPARTCYQR
jgi:hypothetical protein